MADFSFLDYGDGGGGDYGYDTGYDYGGYDYGTPDYSSYAGPDAGSYAGDAANYWDQGGGLGLDYSGAGDQGQGWSPGSLGIDYTASPEAGYVDTSGTYGNPYAAYGSFAGPGAGTDMSGYWDQAGGIGAGGLDYTPSFWDVAKGIPANAGRQFKGKVEANPIGTLAGLLSTGMSMYGAYKTRKEQEAAAKQIADARAARQARWEQYGKPINYQMSRQMLPPPSDLLTAGQRSGGINWFTPTTFTPMADGGGVPAAPVGWLDRIRAAIANRNPAPALVGTGAASAAADAALRNQYQRYAVGEQMEDREPMPYDQWSLDRQGARRAKGGLSGLDGGQDDTIDIRAAPGEYVMDADVVAGLGDGNNAAGAKKLDELRRRVREHKRKAPSDKIPPKAKSIEGYMKKGK